MNKKYHFEIEQIFEIIDLYEVGVPVRTIAKLYYVNDVTFLALYERI